MNCTSVLSEFTELSWLYLLGMEVILLLASYGLIYTMIHCNIEHVPENISKAKYAFGIALTVCLKATINKGSNFKLKSQSYKIVVFSIMVLGLIVLSYYKAQMNAALNVDNNEVPIKTWSDIAQSDYKLLAWKGSIQYNWFRDAHNQEPKNEVFMQIFNEKIETFNDIGFEGTIPKILSGKYLALSISGPYIETKENPCQIIPLKHPELRYCL